MQRIKPRVFCIIIGCIIILVTITMFAGHYVGAPRPTSTLPDTSNNETVNIIFDTDMDSDVDDAGALAVLYSYVQQGRAKVLATVGSCASGSAVRCISGINAYYGFPNVPVGIAPDCPSSGKSLYQEILATIYGVAAPEDKNARPALEVYREALSSADDKSVTLVVVGAMNNLSELLQSPADTYSQLTGTELVKQKVKVCVIMGGFFSDVNKLEEYNIRIDPEAAYYVAHYCPVPIVWSGYEIGGSIFTGDLRNEMETDNPVRLAYNLYGKDGSGTYSRQSWDLTAIMFAVEGLGNCWDIQHGTIEINTDKRFIDSDKASGYNNWTPDNTGKDAILIEKMSPSAIAVYLNSRMVSAKKGLDDLLKEPISQEDVISILYCIAGKPQDFSAPVDEPVEDALMWAIDNTIIDPDEANVVSGSITYEQLIMLLFRFSSYINSTDLSSTENIHYSNSEAANWARAAGLILSQDNYGPYSIVSREQFAAILNTYCTTIFS